MSDLLKKPCSCGGNNPNCYMCGGWGYMDSVAEARKSTEQGELAKSFKKNKTVPSQQSVKQDKYCKEGDAVFSDYITNSDESEEINPRECLFCGYPILKRNIESHIKKYHRNCTKAKKEKIRIALNLLFAILDR